MAFEFFTFVFINLVLHTKTIKKNMSIKSFPGSRHAVAPTLFLYKLSVISS